MTKQTATIAMVGMALGLGAVGAVGGTSCGSPPLRPGEPQPGAPLPGVERPAEAKLLDSFEDVTPWKTVVADGVHAEVRGVAASGAAPGQAMRLVFDFSGTSGYAVARRELPADQQLDLSGNFELAFELRGEAPINNFELKLVDASGDNVWWYHRRDQALTAPWRRVVVKKRQIEFAWGPTADKTLRKIAAIEFVISSGKGGGKGWIEVDELTLRPLPTYDGPPPPLVAVASGADDGQGAGRAVDGKRDTAWRLGGGGGAAELTIDLGRERDLAGVLLHWATPWAQRYAVDVSLDGARWQPASEQAAEVTGGDGGLDPLMMLDTSARFLRLRLRDSSSPGGGFSLAELEVLDAASVTSRNAFLAEVAKRLPRGALPRGFSGEQPYWTVVGVDGGRESGLLSEDGALELWAGGPSIEPFVTIGGEQLGWAQAHPEQTLDGGYLPIPQVTWREHGWDLEVTALAAGDRNGAELAARYVLRNRSGVPLVAQLVLAVRPFQVNPPAQFLNISGGAAPLTDLAWAADDGTLLLDGKPALRPLTPPARVSFAPFHAIGAGPPGIAGSSSRAAAAAGKPPASAALRDRAQLGSAALVYELRVAPGQSAEVVLAAPLLPYTVGGMPLVPPSPTPEELAVDPRLDAAWFAHALGVMQKSWHEKLDRVTLQVPPAGKPIVETLRSSLAYMLLSRDGAMLRPGTRSYARAWIRDGAMISEALLRLGHPGVAAEFLRWYAPYQYASGKVPCCVDAHGAGPVPENDSHGQLMYLARLVYRYGKDRALAAAVWPNVLAAARYQEQLRQSERTAKNQTPGRRALFGLLPPSISHEGYSAKPAYSYWDDFWGLRGLEDAAALAVELGDKAAAPVLAAQRDEFTAELRASILAAAAQFRIPFIPGAADLGDFDATSTTIAVAPGVSPQALPTQMLAATFERYWDEHEARREGKKAWKDYTPYELRTPGTFVRLGQRERAAELFAFFFADRRPAGWNQWAEVVGRLPREVRFIGDMPHAWVHSDYARSALDLFAYERLHDQAMVLAAGVPVAWLEGKGVAIGKLPTPWGPLSYSLSATADALTLELSATQVPPGGFVLPWPWPVARPTSSSASSMWPPGVVRVLGKGRAPRWRDYSSYGRGGVAELLINERAIKLSISRNPMRRP